MKSMSALTPRKSKLKWALNGCLVIGSFHFEQNGMTVRGKPDYAEWYACMEILKQVEEKIVRPFQFWIGDALVYGEQHYGEMYAQAIEVTGLSYSTLANIKYTAAHVAPDQRRIGEISFSAHAEVAALSSDKQEKYLQMAIENEMPTMHLRNKIAKEERGIDPPKIECPFCHQSFTVNRKVEILDAENPVVAAINAIEGKR